MKIRVFTSTNKGKMISLANLIADECSCRYPVDNIPPSYPCEGETLAIIVCTAYKTVSTEVSRFLGGLDRQKARNVALVCDGEEENVHKLTSLISGAGGKVLENILYINGGIPFKFARKYSADEEALIKAWVNKIISEIA